MNLAGPRKEHKPGLRWTRLLASTQLFQTRTRLLVELPGEAARRLLGAGRLPQLAGERGRGDLRHLDPRSVLQGGVARDQDDVLATTVLGREALEHCVGVRRIAHLERAAADEVAEAVEHDDPTPPA